MVEEGTGAFHRLVAGRKAPWVASVVGLATFFTAGLETVQRLTSPSHEEILAEAHQICLTQLEKQAERHRQESRDELKAQFDRFVEAIKLMREE